MAIPISKIIKFPIFQSSFNGVMKTATVKIINAIPKAMAMLTGFNCFSAKSITAPRVVRRYFTRSKNRSATFSFFLAYLSMNKFNHAGLLLST